jgi:UDP-glucose 4-epimerase
MKVLVTGGAGYIGSHAVKCLCAGGADVVVLDDLSRGHRAAVDPKATLVVADILDTDAVATALQDNAIDAVLHFAALSLVGESVRQPELYWHVNVGGSASLLRAMTAVGVQRVVFSSSCSVYGEPARVPVDESFAFDPVSPYGKTKAAVEALLVDIAAAQPGFSATALRYFNVAGCDADGVLGEDHRPETHLIPLVLQAAAGERDAIHVFGTDYPTADGTCVRDYVHVDDLVDAHVRALDLTAGCRALNLGIGRGFSVREVIASAKRITGVDFEVREGPRRPGDPAELFADARAANAALQWQPRFTELDEIVATVWRWKQSVGSYPST